MKDRIIELLKESFPDKDFLSSQTLVDDGVIDSLTAVGLIGLLADELGVEVPYWEVNRENLNSVEQLARLFERLTRQ